MGIRAVENFDTSFELQPQCEEILVKLLSSETFSQQVAKQPGLPENFKVKFSGKLFQPVPWSPNTRFGMPIDYEQYLEDKENFVIINVPPNFMFQAKIFKPSRLCAIYQKDEGENN